MQDAYLNHLFVLSQSLGKVLSKQSLKGALPTKVPMHKKINCKCVNTLFLILEF